MHPIDVLALQPAGGPGWGLVALIFLIVDIWLIVVVAQSRKTLLVRFVWIVLILLLHVVA